LDPRESRNQPGGAVPAPPVDPAAPARTPRGERIASWWEQRTRIPLLGLGIVLCSAMAPIVALQAVTWSTRAGDFDQNSLQDQAIREEHLSADLGVLNQDVRMFGSFAEHRNTALSLNHQAQRLIKRSPALGNQLTREATAENVLVNGFGISLQQSSGLNTGSGPPTFDLYGELAALTANDSELLAAQGTQDQAKAGRAHNKATDYTGVATLWAAGLFFFTLAQVSPPSSHTRRVFAFSGFGVALAALTLMSLVGLYTV
jgi:hypothetical protein